MSGFKRFELLDSPFSFLYRETFLCSPTPPFYYPFAAAITEEEAEHQIGFALDLSLQCLPSPAISSFDLFDTAADLINFRRCQERADMEIQLGASAIASRPWSSGSAEPLDPPQSSTGSIRGRRRSRGRRRRGLIGSTSRRQRRRAGRRRT